MVISVAGYKYSLTTLFFHCLGTIPIAAPSCHSHHNNSCICNLRLVMRTSVIKIAPFLALEGLASSYAQSLARRELDGDISWVYLGENGGFPEQRASGVLYGIPDNGAQIPDHFYENMGFNNHRTGGAQSPEPCRGWTYGYDEFVVSSINETIDLTFSLFP